MVSSPFCVLPKKPRPAPMSPASGEVTNASTASRIASQRVRPVSPAGSFIEIERSIMM
jgi:hypothetical protein